LMTQGTADTEVDICGVAELPLGTVDNTCAADDEVSVLLLGRDIKTLKMVASEAINPGEEVFTAASGKVQNRPSGAGTYWFVGVALSKVTADNQIIEVNHTVPVKLVIA